MKYGIYSVDEYPEQNGKWGGFRVRVVQSEGKQGKLYPRFDSKDHYKAKSETEDLEI